MNRQALILGMSSALTAEQAEQIRAEIRNRLPGVEVIVIGGVMSLATLDVPMVGLAGLGDV